MPSLAKGLTDLAVKNAKRKDNRYTLADGLGLHLEVLPTGRKSWFARYRLPDGKQRTVVLGIYPDLSLADARVRAGEIQSAGRKGGRIIGARAEAKMRVQERTAEQLLALQAAEEVERYAFTRLSEAWLASRKSGWADESYRKARYVVRERLQPAIGKRDMRTLRSPDVTETLRTIAATTPSLAKKAVQYLNGVVDYCIHEGVREDDQVLRLKGVLPRHRGGHVPAVTRQQGVGQLIRTIQAYEGGVVRSALLLAAWTALRPGVVASARWSEIDLERGEWHIPGMNADRTRRMKAGHDHLVSLPTQAVAMLRDVQQVSGGAEYVFPAVGKQKNPHLHRDALSRALRLMGFAGEHSPHGFRAMLRTIARERLKIDFDVLEAQLAHAKRDQIQAAYDRTGFVEERKEAMQKWADYLDVQAASGADRHL
ncbi:tyrosine-type recombinase/integrase [Achromobacter kerstersii]|uniref:tyrosine-type recombinase/integrase n=1 Tax=Achromobacter kerstersii TaxID=1353890 RepID=UPI0032095341